MKLRGIGVWAAIFLFIIAITWVASSTAARPGSGAQPVSAAALVSPAGPAWWPADLPLASGAVYQGEKEGAAQWRHAAANVDADSNAFRQRAASAGYQVFGQAAEQGQTYTLFVMKGGSAFRMKVDRAGGGTTYTARAVGIMHVKASGAATAEFDLPLTGVPYTVAEGYFNLATRAPNGSCAGCDYVVNIDVESYTGPGTYTSKDALFNLAQGGPGPEYTGTASCSVTVKGGQGGSYSCTGLTQKGSSRSLDVSGTWQIPQQ